MRIELSLSRYLSYFMFACVAVAISHSLRIQAERIKNEAAAASRNNAEQHNRIYMRVYLYDIQKYVCASARVLFIRLVFSIWRAFLVCN